MLGVPREEIRIIIAALYTYETMRVFYALNKSRGHTGVEYCRF